MRANACARAPTTGPKPRATSRASKAPRLSVARSTASATAARAPPAAGDPPQPRRRRRASTGAQTLLAALGPLPWLQRTPAICRASRPTSLSRELRAFVTSAPPRALTRRNPTRSACRVFPLGYLRLRPAHSAREPTQGPDRRLSPSVDGRGREGEVSSMIGRPSEPTLPSELLASFENPCCSALFCSVLAAKVRVRRREIECTMASPLPRCCVRAQMAPEAPF